MPVQSIKKFLHSTTIYVRGVLQKFGIADPFSAKNQQMDFKLKKLYSPDAFFIWIEEFVDACYIPHRVPLFKGLLLQGSSLVLVYPTLNLCTHRFTVDFVITFHTPSGTFSCDFHNPKYFLVLKTK